MIEISADLRCEIDSRPFMIRSEDRTIVVEVPDVASGLKILQLSLPRGSRRKRMQSFKEILEGFGAIIEAKVDGTSLFVVGNRRGSRFWTLIGLPATEIKIRNVLRVWLSSLFGKRRASDSTK